MSAQRERVSERRTEQLLAEVLESQGWNLSRPPNGHLLQQQEYKSHPALVEVFREASKSGKGPGLPEAVLVDPASLVPLVVIEAKANENDISVAVKEATHDYGAACISKGYPTLAVGVAGADADTFTVRVHKWTGSAWEPVTYDGNPISWIPNPEDVEKISAPSSDTELRPTPSPEHVLADRADEINRLLRESGVKDEFRPAVLGATMLGLWKSGGRIRKDVDHILPDVNQECEKAFWDAGKPELAKSLRIDEANHKLAVKARRIVEILERLNVTTLTAEHDYLGQLYETFFHYTGGNTIGQYFTPRHVTQMMADLCEVDRGDKILDPACGTGGFLIAAMNRIQRQENMSRSQIVDLIADQLIGFEQEPITAALCVANMILRGDGTVGVRRGDCFSSSEYPIGEADVVLLNPPFPHTKTDVPPEDFIERGLEGLQRRGRLAVVVPTSLCVKRDKGKWREKVLEKNTLLGVVKMPNELFEPFASSDTSIVVLEKDIPHNSDRKTAFARVKYDGLTLKKSVRVPRADGRNQIPDAINALLNNERRPGFSGTGAVSGRDEWSPGEFVPSAPPSDDEIIESVDVLLRRLTAFYVRYAKEIVEQREAVDGGEIPVVPYRRVLSNRKLANAEGRPSQPGTIGGMFDIVYGMKELHSREGIPPGQSLIISPTDSYNGCYGWLEFEPLLRPPFVTVAQTGNIGEAFVQLEPCAVNDDCLVLLSTDKDQSLADLVLTAATLRLERWRFSYGRKLTPDRICDFAVRITPELRDWTTNRLAQLRKVGRAALDVYEQAKAVSTGKVPRSYRAENVPPLAAEQLNIDEPDDVGGEP